MSKRLIFVSNYLSHYSRSISEAFIRIYGEGFKFVAMTPFNQKRLAAGFRDMNQLPFVLRAYESPETQAEARRLILESECVIVGGMPVSIISERLSQGKLTFMQSERFFKGPLWKDAVRFAKYWRYSGGREYARDPKAKFYLLCASAYAAWDYGVCGLFRGKAYRWGYFPELKSYDSFTQKDRGSILWAGRFLDWKHPDLAVNLAERLKSAGKKFRVKIVGSGEMQGELERMIAAKNLSDCVELTGALPVEEVRAEMERSEVFLFTSDRGEGWGVVLNEAMNSGCVVMADLRAGASPYLVRDGENGMLFRGLEDLTAKVSAVLEDELKFGELGRKAYRSMAEEWSADVAARRFVELSAKLRDREGGVSLWGDGPCSVAPVV